MLLQKVRNIAIIALVILAILVILPLLIIAALIVIPIRIIALAIVGIVDLALLAFSGLRSIKSFITSQNIQTKRESLYSEATVEAKATVELSIKYRHHSLLKLARNSLAMELDNYNPTGTFAGVLKELFKYALSPFYILNNALFGLRSDTKSCLKRSLQASRYIELTLKQANSSVVKITTGLSIGGTAYMKVILPDGNCFSVIANDQIIQDTLRFICLSEMHCMDTNTAQYSDFINEILRIGAAYDTAVEHRTTVCNSKPADIINVEQRLLNAISTMVDIHYQGKSLASAVPAESITVNNAEHLPGNTEERSKTP